ncbi:MAG: response regulator [Rhodothermales bacterium]
MGKTLNRILLVEDDLDIQAIARLALETLGGFTVEVCSRGQEALDKAPAFAPDMIILDVMMPGMDGPTTLQALRQVPAVAAVPAVFMTARVQQHEIDQYKELGAVDVIRKPFDPMALPTILTAVWETCCD